MIGTDNKIPKLLNSFLGVLVLKSFPRRPADAGVGTVESFRCHVQHHALIRRLSKQLAQIYITVFKNPNGCYINFLKSFFSS
jgi:hypothetical protein